MREIHPLTLTRHFLLLPQAQDESGSSRRTHKPLIVRSSGCSERDGQSPSRGVRSGHPTAHQTLTAAAPTLPTYQYSSALSALFALRSHGRDLIDELLKPDSGIVSSAGCGSCKFLPICCLLPWIAATVISWSRSPNATGYSCAPESSTYFLKLLNRRLRDSKRRGIRDCSQHMEFVRGEAHACNMHRAQPYSQKMLSRQEEDPQSSLCVRCRLRLHAVPRRGEGLAGHLCRTAVPAVRSRAASRVASRHALLQRLRTARRCSASCCHAVGGSSP